MNPCDNCTRVPEPDACDNKRCPDWKAWWVSRWDKTRLDLLRLLDRQEMLKEEMRLEKVDTCG